MKKIFILGFLLASTGICLSQTLCTAQKRGNFSDTGLWVTATGTGGTCESKNMCGANGDGINFATNGYFVSLDCAAFGSNGNGIDDLRESASNTFGITNVAVDAGETTITLTSAAVGNIFVDQYISIASLVTATWANNTLCRVTVKTPTVVTATPCISMTGTNPLTGHASYNAPDTGGLSTSVGGYCSYDGTNAGVCPFYTNQAFIQTVAVDGSGNLTLVTDNTGNLATGMNVVFRGFSWDMDVDFLNQLTCSSIVVVSNTSISCLAANWSNTNLNFTSIPLKIKDVAGTLYKTAYIGNVLSYVMLGGASPPAALLTAAAAVDVYFQHNGSGTNGAYGGGSVSNPGSNAVDFGFFLPQGFYSGNYSPTHRMTIHTTGTTSGSYWHHDNANQLGCTGIATTGCTGTAGRLYTGAQIYIANTIIANFLGTASTGYLGISIDHLTNMVPTNFIDVENNYLFQMNQIEFKTGATGNQSGFNIIAHNYCDTCQNAATIKFNQTISPVNAYLVGNTGAANPNNGDLVNIIATPTGMTNLFNVSEGPNNTTGYRNVLTVLNTGSGTGGNLTAFNWAWNGGNATNGSSLGINYASVSTDLNSILAMSVSEGSFSGYSLKPGTATASPFVLINNIAIQNATTQAPAQGPFFIEFILNNTKLVSSGLIAKLQGNCTASTGYADLAYDGVVGTSTVTYVEDNKSVYIPCDNATIPLIASLYGDGGTSGGLTNAVQRSGIFANYGLHGIAVSTKDNTGSPHQTYDSTACGGIGVGACFSSTFVGASGTDWQNSQTVTHTWSTNFCGQTANSITCPFGNHPSTVCDGAQGSYCETSGIDPTFRDPTLNTASFASWCGDSTVDGLFTDWGNRWQGTANKNCSIRQGWKYIYAGMLPMNLRMFRSGYNNVTKGSSQMAPPHIAAQIASF